MRLEDEVRLKHMLEAAQDALRFSSGRVRAELDDDRQLTFALVKAVEIVGEAAYQMEDTTRGELSQIPWPDIVKMRHRLVHAYFDINLDILWDTVQRNLPPLIAELEKVLGRKA